VVAPYEGGTKDALQVPHTGHLFKLGNRQSFISAIKSTLELTLTKERMRLLDEHVAQYSNEAFYRNFSKQIESTLKKQNRDS
jgi:hypothetical protein